jgi:hypothetical protein
MEEPTKAYVLVQADPQTRGIAKRLRAVPGILFAKDITGPYDALALAGSARGGIGLDAILRQVRALPGVIRALPAPLSAGPAQLPSADAA